MTTRVMLTGAGGFVGSHVLRHLLAKTNWDIVCPVTFRHRGNADRILSACKDFPNWRDRVEVVVWDLTAPFSSTMRARLRDPHVILNVASESHVDRSITDPVPFVRNNVDIMLNLLEYARSCRNLRMFLQMSTDEVFGPAPDDTKHDEWAPIIPSNPYSASKAAQEAIAISYWRTYGIPLIITNTMNIIGEMQDAEKFVSKTIKAAYDGGSITVHVSPEGNPGSRFYIHARNFADGWLYIVKNADVHHYADGHDRPNRYNIVGEKEIDNLTMAQMIRAFTMEHAGINALPEDHAPIELVDFHSSRPGHDLRYALDGKKLAELGWTPPVSIEDSLRSTVEWTVDRPEWLL